MGKKRIPSDAFDFYVSLGHGRSYRQVSDHYCVSKRAVTKIAVREDWAVRLDHIERQARTASDKKLVESLDDMRTRHLERGQVLRECCLHSVSSV